LTSRTFGVRSGRFSEEKLTSMSAITKLKTIAGKAPMVRTIYNVVMQRSVGSRETYAEDFIEFVAARRGIAPHKARDLVSHAQKQFSGGWSGDEYRQFSEQALETFKPLYDDTTDREVILTYKFHGPLDFLRMLGYAVPKPKEIDEVVSRLASKGAVELVDYGCGLAHRTLAISRQLKALGCSVKLNLVDIRKELHGAFLEFLCQKHGIAHEFIEVSPEQLYPSLPTHDYCDNVSVLEHIREPVVVIDNIDRALKPGGLFLAYVADQEEEMMHISPDLSSARRRMKELGYTQIAKVQGVPLFQKPAAS
jgi:SAM-dependent methyltransferase